jgi:uncharacterized membrane protein YccC
MPTNAASLSFGKSLMDRLAASGEPLLFGLRLWASVCLALFVAFWLELDDQFWAGISAAVVCQPQLGASLRKGWFRMIGTVVGAIATVLLTACFPQDRIGFFGFLALWCSVCAFGATVLRNFASYGAALAGYTAAIIGANALGATGGPGPDVFLLAVTRAAEICIGIVSAGVVHAGTDLGGAQRRLAVSLASLATEITGRFSRMLALAGPELPDTQNERREFVRRVIALEPIIEQAIGESSHVRYRSATLQTAVHGLFRALEGWRGIATGLKRGFDGIVRREAENILRSIPLELRWSQEPSTPARWADDPVSVRSIYAEAERRLLALSVGTPSLRLLVDETTKVFSGILHVLDALAVLVDAHGQPPSEHRGGRPNVPDRLPALVNAARAFVTIGMVELFWVATAWPNGATAMMFAANVLLLLSPLGDRAYGGAIAGVLAVVVSAICAAITKFAALPALETFPSFCGAIGLFLVPWVSS